MARIDRCETHAEAAAKLLMGTPTGADREKAAGLLMDGCVPALIAKLKGSWRFKQEDAEEVAVDVVLTFLKDPPRDAPAKAYLFCLLPYKAKDRVRASMTEKRGSGQSAVSLDQSTGDDPDGPTLDVAGPHDTAALVSLRQCLEWGLATMRREVPHYASLLEMVAEEWTTGEVAERLGISVAAAKDRVYRVRTEVRRYFQQCKG